MENLKGPGTSRVEDDSQWTSSEIPHLDDDDELLQMMLFPEESRAIDRDSPPLMENHPDSQCQQRPVEKGISHKPLKLTPQVATVNKNCLVPGCHSLKTTTQYHLPQDPQILCKWLTFIGKEESKFAHLKSNKTTICSAHFDRHSYANLIQVEMGFAKRLKLKDDAVPSIYPDGSMPKAREVGCQWEGPEMRDVAVQVNLLPQALNWSTTNSPMVMLQCVDVRLDQPGGGFLMGLCGPQPTTPLLTTASKTPSPAPLSTASKTPTSPPLSVAIKTPAPAPLKVASGVKSTSSPALTKKRSAPESQIAVSKRDAPAPLNTASVSVARERSSHPITAGKSVASLPEETTILPQEASSLPQQTALLPPCEESRGGVPPGLIAPISPKEAEELNKLHEDHDYCKKSNISYQDCHLVTLLPSFQMGYLVTQKRPFRCGLCGQNFSTAHDQIKHRRMHLRCSVCQRDFSSKRDFVHHMFIHTGKKPYSCEFCNSHFRRPGALKRHKRAKHRKEMAHDSKDCGVCCEGVHTRRSLRDHLELRKDFTCSGCAERFYTQRELNSHRKLKHWEDKMKPKQPPVVRTGRKRGKRLKGKPPDSCRHHCDINPSEMPCDVIIEPHSERIDPSVSGVSTTHPTIPSVASQQLSDVKPYHDAMKPFVVLQRLSDVTISRLINPSLKPRPPCDVIINTDNELINPSGSA